MAGENVLELSAEHRATLSKWLRSSTTRRSVAERARIVLLTADGMSITEIQNKLDVSRPTVCKWRRRYREQGDGQDHAHHANQRDHGEGGEAHGCFEVLRAERHASGRLGRQITRKKLEAVRDRQIEIWARTAASRSCASW